MLELYHSGLTTCSKQVRHCLTEKGLDYVTRFVQLARFENLSPEYLKLNPKGVVPTLVHDGNVVTNSFVIMEYIEDVFPENPLRPADPLARAKARFWSWNADDVHLSVTSMTYQAFIRGRVKDMTEAEIDDVAARTPVPDRREKWRRITHGGYVEREMELAEEKTGYVLDEFGKAIGDGPWVCGDVFSLADVSMLAIIHRMGEIRPEMITPEARPEVAAWHDRMRARPAVIKTYSPDTDEVKPQPEQFGMAKAG